MDNNSKRFKQIDDRGSCDLERVIEEQRNHITILERLLEDSQEETKKVKKQVEFLQNQIRKYGKKIVCNWGPE